MSSIKTGVGKLENHPPPDVSETSKLRVVCRGMTYKLHNFFSVKNETSVNKLFYSGL